MTLIRASEWSESTEDWLIEGLVGPAITLLSGEPKMGKSMLAGLIVNSLVTQQPFLNRTPREGDYQVAWLGYDSNWASEFLLRFPAISSNVFLQKISLNYNDLVGWNQLYAELVENNINLIVIDHLYGLASELDLDESHFMNEALKPIKHISDEMGIPVLLLAHAGKTGSGRALHSVILEASARHLLRVLGNVKSINRDLVILGNGTPSSTLKITLTPEGAQLKSEQGVSNMESRTSIRNGEMLNAAKALLSIAPESARKNLSSAGRWFARNGFCGTDDAGRTYAGKLVRGQLLAKATSKTNELIAGPRLTP